MARLQSALGGVRRLKASAMYAACAASSRRATLQASSPAAVRLQKLL
jgi:hypothetical protein